MRVSIVSVTLCCPANGERSLAAAQDLTRGRLVQPVSAGLSTRNRNVPVLSEIEMSPFRTRTGSACGSLWKTVLGFCASSERLARSAGGSPARATARSPVAWIAGRREIEDLKPIDNPIGRMGASHRAAAKANADVASKERSPEGPTCETGVKAAWARHTLANVPAHFGGVGSGSTVTRTR
jgi:hypothetical protein